MQRWRVTEYMYCRMPHVVLMSRPGFEYDPYFNFFFKLNFHLGLKQLF